MSVPALGQNSGFQLGQIGPSKGEIVGAIIGAAVVIGVVVYLVIPKQSTIGGCVESGDRGLWLRSEKDHRIYVLDTGRLSVQAGQRVILKGKKGKKSSGTREFEVRKLLQDEGSCKVPS
jgi:hypothetical protein